MKMNESARKLAEDNFCLVYSFAKKYNIDMEEYFGDIAIGLCNAAIKYDECKGSFSTFAYICMKAEFVDSFNRSKRKSCVPSNIKIPIDKEYCSDNSKSSMSLEEIVSNNLSFENDTITKMMIEHFLDELNSDKKKEMVKLIIDGHRIIDIAEKFNCSFQNVSLAKKDFKNILKKYYFVNEMKR